MTFFKKEEPTENKKYEDKYNIFEDKVILDALEEEKKQFSNHLYPFFALCESKGWIRIIYRKEKDLRDKTIDFTVLHNVHDPNCRTATDFTDYCAREKALQKRKYHFIDKQKEADKQRLLLREYQKI
jgi:hypothetical protein